MRIVCALVVAPVLAGCAARSPRQSPDPLVVREDSVYRAALEYLAETVRRGETLYVAGDEDPTFESEAAADAWVERGWGGLRRAVPPSLLRAYARANVVPARFRVPRFVRGRRMMPASEAPPEGGRKLRYLLSISRPGFSAGGDSALVAVGRVCGMLCGTSGMALAVRGRSSWRVERELWSVQH